MLNWLNLKELFKISEFTGLPPIVLGLTLALFCLFFVFGLVIIVKVRRIRRNMMFVNRSLDTISHKMQNKLKSKVADKLSSAKSNTISKPPLQKPDRSRFLNDRSNELLLVSQIRAQHRNSIKENSDLTKENLGGGKTNHADIKNNIISLLQNTNKPTSFYDIAKHLSNGSPDYNFEFILKELDRLKAAEKIVGQVSAGKLYFQLK